jgi:hypothetical protein
MSFAAAVLDAILDRSPGELIGALLIASAIGGLAMGLDAIVRRRRPAPPIFVGALALVVSLSSMALTAGYHAFETRRALLGDGPPPDRPGRPPSPKARGAGPFGWSSGFHVVIAADRDRDGRVTPEEAARLVRDADADGKGSVDFREIDRFLLDRARPDREPDPDDPGRAYSGPSPAGRPSIDSGSPPGPR